MKDKVNIICLYWVGEFRRRDFSLNDVERLYQSVLKHIDRPFDFYCLTNTEEELPEYINRIDLLHSWPGWWSKVELHRPDLPEGRTLYMDLDSHVIRDLSPILDYEGELIMFPSPMLDNPNKIKKLESESPRWVIRYQAATMLFTPGCEAMTLVWNRFLEDPTKWMREFRSEQDIMGEWIPDLNMFPRKWMIKLNTIRNYETPPEDTIIVTGQTKDGLFRNTKSISWFEQMAR